MNKIREIVRNIENSPLSLGYYLLTFIFIIQLRTYIELLSIEKEIANIDLALIFHYNVFYVSALFSFILLFHAFLGISIGKLTRLIIPGFLILLIPPIIDLLLTNGEGFRMSYIDPGDNLWERYLSFFGEFNENGVSYGIKTEITLVLFSTALYSWYKRKQWWRSVIMVWGVYTIFFLYGITPQVYLWLFKAFDKPVDVYAIISLTYYFMALIAIQGIVLTWLHSPIIVKMLVKDIRPLRVLHYIMMFIFGIVYAGSYVDTFDWQTHNYFEFAYIIVALILAIMFSIVTNNIADFDIDTISNPNRPLIQNKISKADYNKLAVPFLLLSILYAAIVNSTALYVIIVFIGNYYLYSMPPLRLKRLPIISKAIIGFNSVILVMLGFYFITGSLDTFPKSFVFNMVLLLTLSVNFIDLKDYEGDKLAGIKTLPVLIGLRLAKLIIGLMMLLAYLYVWYLLNNKWEFDTWTLVAFSLLGILQFAAINKRNYNEKWIFAIYFLSFIGLIVYWKLKGFELILTL